MQTPDSRARHDEAAFRQVKLVEQTTDVIDGAIGDRHHIRARRRRNLDADRVHWMRLLVTGRYEFVRVNDTEEAESTERICHRDTKTQRISVFRCLRG